ncbi:MAG: hypothetical protein Q9162_001012 [Coniocarpon cinnabarinum]
MFKEGKQDGWLRLPLDSLPAFLRVHNVETTAVKAVSTKEKGNALVAADTLDSQRNPLVTVPPELILSKESVCYIKFLNTELLPTFWTEEECALFEGTSLQPAHDAKMHSLYREFDELRRLTGTIQWCRDVWWNEIDGILDFDDWKQVDAIYRSRALEFPGIGDALVPYIGFANHASGDETKAAYQADDDGRGILLLYDDKQVKEGEEITITYGDDKGACEMIFSYGFLEEKVESAKTVYLDINIPDDDPLRRPKQAWDPCPPGVRLSHSHDNQVSWDGDFIWMAVLNEEDGLEFSVAETVDGERELRLYFDGEHVTGMEELKQKITQSGLFEVFLLRAIVLLENRVIQQLKVLGSVEERCSSDVSTSSGVRDQPQELAERLRVLEGQLLGNCVKHFEQEKVRLADTKTVQQFLQAQQSRDDEEDDFA